MAAPRPKLPTATPELFEDGLTLMRMRTENVKRTRYIDISLDRDLTTIGGDNAQGKSSFVNALRWVVGGKAAIELDPIHDGAQQGAIIADFGDGKNVQLSLTCTLLRVGDDGWTTSLDLEIPGYITPSKVQGFIDQLAGQFTDPLEFDRMTDEKKFDVCRAFVGTFDFKANSAGRKVLYEKRTKVNGDATREYASAQSIAIPAQAPAEKINEDALTKELKDAGEHNTMLERRRNNRQVAVDKVATLRTTASERAAKAETAVAAEIERSNAFVQELRDQIDALGERIVAAQNKLAEDVVQLRRDAKTETEKATAEAYALQAQIDGAEELPPVKDATEIETRLTTARTSNKALDDWQQQRDRRAAHMAAGAAHAKQSDELTAQIAELDQQRQDAITKARLPVDGLGFGDGVVTLNGKAWEGASTAERIDASTAIAIAMNPKLKVILIRDGSNLGSAMKERIRERAKAHGFRVLMEIVDETGANSHIYIEDGVVRKIDGKDVPVMEPAAADDDQPSATAVGRTADPAPARAARKPWRGPNTPAGDAA